MVSLLIMTLAFGVLKPPCLSPAKNITSGKLAWTFHAFLKAHIHTLASLTLSCDSQFAITAEYLNLHHPVNLLRLVYVLVQLLDGVEHFLSDIVMFKSQDASDCETDPHVLDWIPRHHYLGLSSPS